METCIYLLPSASPLLVSLTGTTLLRIVGRSATYVMYMGHLDEVPSLG